MLIKKTALCPTSSAGCSYHGPGTCSPGHEPGQLRTAVAATLETTAPDFSIFKRRDPVSSHLSERSSLGFYPRQKPGVGPGWGDLGWRAELPIEETSEELPSSLCAHSRQEQPIWGGVMPDASQGQASPSHPKAEAASKGLRGRKKPQVLPPARHLSIQHTTSCSW